MEPTDNDYLVECSNDGCYWGGTVSQCMTLKNRVGEPDQPLCPNCYEVTERVEVLTTTQEKPMNNLMDESEAYTWAAQCLRPIETLVEGYKLQQCADLIASAILEASGKGHGES